MTLNDLYKKVKVIHFGTNRFLKLCIVTFVLRRTVKLQNICHRQKTDGRTQHCSISATVSTVG